MIQLLRDWALVFSMVAGVSGYFLFSALPFGPEVHIFANRAVNIIQPALIFLMLFLTFCKVELRALRLRPWHWRLLLIQGGLFSLIAVALILMPSSGLRVVLEGAMICLICPTATAAAVITRKLGGNLNDIITYTVLINLLTAVMVSLWVPWVHPAPGLSMAVSGALILSKVFPLLLMPLICGLAVRQFMPAFHRKLQQWSDASFYLWVIALALAMAVTARSMVHSAYGPSTQLWIGAVALLCCIFQFKVGRKIGRRYGETITAGQALGQKNTVFAIWLGYTFFTPVTALAGGFYSIFHNLVNSIQLYRHIHKNPTPPAKV